MTKFENAVEVVLQHEGGFVDDPADPGGATNWGISFRFLKDTLHRDATVAMVRDMFRAEAIAIYLTYFWRPNGYQDIADQTVATKVFDMAVNMGPEQAHKILQRGLIALGANVADDGILGPKTMAATNQADPVQLIGKIVGLQADFYTDLVARKPALRKFLHNWLHRASWPLGHPEKALI